MTETVLATAVQAAPVWLDRDAIGSRRLPIGNGSSIGNVVLMRKWHTRADVAQMLGCGESKVRSSRDFPGDGGNVGTQQGQMPHRLPCVGKCARTDVGQ
jgi:hypothetical protein